MWQLTKPSLLIVKVIICLLLRLHEVSRGIRNLVAGLSENTSRRRPESRMLTKTWRPFLESNPDFMSNSQYYLVAP